jgi:hypothetical protein
MTTFPGQGTPAATLPTGFDRPDWTIEQVLAWLTYGDLDRLRALALADPKLPKW